MQCYVFSFSFDWIVLLGDNLFWCVSLSVIFNRLQGNTCPATMYWLTALYSILSGLPLWQFYIVFSGIVAIKVMRVYQPLLLFNYERLDSRQNGIIFLCSPTSNDSSTVFSPPPPSSSWITSLWNREKRGGRGKENTVSYEEFFFIAIYFSTFRPLSITMPWVLPSARRPLGT